MNYPDCTNCRMKDPVIDWLLRKLAAENMALEKEVDELHQLVHAKTEEAKALQCRLDALSLLDSMKEPTD